MWGQLVEGDARGAGKVADLGHLDGGWDYQLAFAVGMDEGARVCEQPSEPFGSGARTAPPALLQSGQLASGDQTAVVDHHEVVGQVLDLVEQMAGDKDGVAGCGTFAQQVTQPADALGVEAVARFVEDQEGGSPSSAAAKPSRCRMPSE